MAHTRLSATPYTAHCAILPACADTKTEGEDKAGGCYVLKAAGTPMTRPVLSLSRSLSLTFSPGEFSISSTLGSESPAWTMAAVVVREKLRVREVVLIEEPGMGARGRRSKYERYMGIGKMEGGAGDQGRLK